MSIETELARYPKDSRFIPEFTRRPEFRKGHSRMRGLADMLYDEGRSSFSGIYEAIVKARGFAPSDPFSPHIPPEFFPRIGLHGGAILWGSLFRVTEDVVVNRVYDPNNFSRLLTMGFAGCKWGDSIKINTGNPVMYAREELKALTELTTSDKSFSFLFKEGGLHHLPIRLQDDVISTGFYKSMKDYLGPVYIPLAERLLASPLTSAEISAKTRGRDTVPSQNTPLTFR